MSKQSGLGNFIPSEYDSGCQSALEEICNATMTRLKQENYVNFRNELVVFTCVDVFMQELARYIRNHPEEEVTIASLIKFRTSRSESENGEKGGNIVPVCELGEKFKLGVKNDDLTDGEEDDEEE